MQISLNNLWEEPDEPYYSFIIDNYSKKGLFDPIDVGVRITNNAINSIFRWIDWIDWRLEKVDGAKWDRYISDYINTNFSKCTDLEILYWLLQTKPDIQSDDNFRYYIQLYENKYKDIVFQKPFNLWIDLFKLHTEYWSEYFINKKFIISTNSDYPNRLLVDLISRLGDTHIKKKWFEKFIKNQPNSAEFLKLLIHDNAYNNSGWYRHFKSLNPSASQVCSLILRKSEKQYAFSNKVDTNDIFWFYFFQSREGSNLPLLIFVMYRCFKNVHNHIFNLEHWKRFLFHIQSDLGIIEHEINNSKNENLKNKWICVKKELFNIDKERLPTRNIAKSGKAVNLEDICPF